VEYNLMNLKIKEVESEKANIRPLVKPGGPGAGKGLSDPEFKRKYNKDHFKVAASRYDIATRCLSLFQDRKWKDALVSLIPMKNSGRVLDLACGTGDVCLAIAERFSSPHLTGIDISPAMLNICEERARAAAVKMTVVEGDITVLPFADGDFETVTASYALRNSPSLGATISEVHRVLKPGGTLLILDFSKSSNRFVQVFQSVLLTFWGGLWGLLLHADPRIHGYIGASLGTYPPQCDVIRMIEGAGMCLTFRRRFMGGATELLSFSRL
jgi:demethylmenaquinone methyltransferase/2-methoxy-6-polyprenyl-1,4-benzoquinol methylase